MIKNAAQASKPQLQHLVITQKANLARSMPSDYYHRQRRLRGTFPCCAVSF